VRKDEMGGVCSTYWRLVRSAYKIKFCKPAGKRPLGRPRHRWEDNIIMDLRKGNVWTGFMWLKIGTSGGLL
jgi:hypothetical protein